jgi:molybdopterin-guanine dinucleotide biosynthesis protein
MKRRPIIVGIGGLTSEVGKTTLLCRLLKEFPGFEAIKVTRGHYRSCGKDPHTCCVSDLLDEKPVVRSGRELTFTPGKDTGRYWEAGATNVHWVIGTDEQIAAGVEEALDHVQADGVFVEGNSFAQFIAPDFFIMVGRSDNLKAKATAKKMLPSVSAFYISDDRNSAGADEVSILIKSVEGEREPVPVFRATEFDALVGLLGITIRQRELSVNSALSAELERSSSEQLTQR